MKTKNTKIWLISDTHFFHDNLVKWGHRDTDFTQDILKKLSVIHTDDILIHMGDICMGNDAEAHRLLTEATSNCRKILVRGNHDNKSDSWYYDHGWHFVCEEFTLRRQHKNIYFTHRPRDKRHDIHINIHGHTHGNQHHESIDLHLSFYHVDISPELVGMSPQLLDTLLSKMNN